MPQGKHILGRSPTPRVFGTAKVGDRGQIVIPKDAREMFGLEPGDQLVLLADRKKGVALQTTDKLNPMMRRVFEETEAEEAEE